MASRSCLRQWLQQFRNQLSELVRVTFFYNFVIQVEQLSCPALRTAFQHNGKLKPWFVSQ